jgi:DegV family protein with EDD domain
MSVVIVTDSAAALPRALVDAHHIEVVPMHLSVDGVSIRDAERDLGELLGDTRVTTSAPAPGDFRAAITRALDGPDRQALVLTIASNMSAAHQTATVAAREFPATSVRVIDTMTAAGAQALVVLAAARAAGAGRSLDDVADVARAVIARVRLVATVPDLAHLVRSGRVPGIAAWAGRTFGISPLFEFADGKVRRLRPALGPDAALDRIVARFHRSRRADQDIAHVLALHALAPETAAALLDRVSAYAAPDDAIVSEFGSVMLVHAGPGLVGLAWWWESQP